MRISSRVFIINIYNSYFYTECSNIARWLFWHCRYHAPIWVIQRTVFSHRTFVCAVENYVFRLARRRRKNIDFQTFSTFFLAFGSEKYRNFWWISIGVSNVNHQISKKISPSAKIFMNKKYLWNSKPLPTRMDRTPERVYKYLHP